MVALGAGPGLGVYLMVFINGLYDPRCNSHRALHILWGCDTQVLIQRGIYGLVTDTSGKAAEESYDRYRLDEQQINRSYPYQSSPCWTKFRVMNTSHFLCITR